MILARELFFDLVQKVEQCGLFTQILEKQQMKYQLQPFKLQGIDCKAIKRIYEALQSKYFETHELSEDPHNWNENQRRVFIWYIIFYTYFLAQNDQELNQDHWPVLSSIFFNKRQEFLQFQYLSMIKPAKINWTAEEDLLLTESVRHEGAGRWNEVAKYFFFTSQFTIFKSPKHCRQRWLNHLDDKKKHGQWTPQEDLLIFNYVSEYGKRWCKLVPILSQSRTEHMIKNRYNSLLNKQRGNKKEREELSVSKIRRQLRKQIENNERKKNRKEQSQNKMPNEGIEDNQQKIQKQQKEIQDEYQRPMVKIENVLEQGLEIKLAQSEKTSSCEIAKALKEQNEVDYIVHEIKDQKNNTDAEEKHSSEIKSEQCQSKIKHIQPQYPYDYNQNYPFINPYNGMSYVRPYPYYWL